MSSSPDPAARAPADRHAPHHAARARIAGRLVMAWLALAPLFTPPAVATGRDGCDKARASCRPAPPPLTVTDITTASPVRRKDTSEESPVISRRSVSDAIAAAKSGPPVHATAPTPWYKTTLGIAGIGLAATAATLPLDRDINRFAQRHISYSFRKNIPLNIADALTDGSLLFAGATMFQSPWSSAKLAHASSVAATATFITTAAVFGLKFAFGRQRPGGPGSSPYLFHPFSSRYDIISGGSIIKLGSGQTASFPSGHTAVAFSIITPYAEIYHEPWLYAIPVTVGISRIIAVDGHWASDVVAGGLLGWLTADLTRRFFPDSDFGVMLFGDRIEMHKSF